MAVAQILKSKSTQLAHFAIKDSTKNLFKRNFSLGHLFNVNYSASIRKAKTKKKKHHEIKMQRKHTKSQNRPNSGIMLISFR